MSFRITGLPAERFAHLFALSDQELVAQGAVRRIADGRMPGYPCRVSLTDSRAGDELILVNYEHHVVDSPYRMRFAIYVREGDTTYDAIDSVPEQLRIRTLAVRAFDLGWLKPSSVLVLHRRFPLGQASRCGSDGGRELERGPAGRAPRRAQRLFQLRRRRPPRRQDPEGTV